MRSASRVAALDSAAFAIERHATELADLIVREVAKPRAEAVGEVARTVGLLRYYAQQVLAADGEVLPSSGPASSLLLTRRVPRGVAGLITPWNFPLAIPMWKAAAAAAYGNAVLLKPSPDATAMALRIEELLGPLFPSGLFQVVPGGAETGRALVDVSDVVSFTGSVSVGQQVTLAAARRNLPSQAEMGGQNASVVLPDADLDFTALTIASAAMAYAGQKCTATSRVIVVGDPAPLTEALVAAIRALPFGDPDSADTVLGPVINEPARDGVVEAVSAAEQSGGTVLTGGRTNSPGWYVEPTVIRGLASDHPLAQREVFGPICLILPVDNDEEAIAVANSTDYGLAGALFTRDLDRALHLAPRLEAGMIKVNAPTTGADYYAPFGGERTSSYGPREQGTAARELYASSRTISVFPGSTP